MQFGTHFRSGQSKGFLILFLIVSLHSSGVLAASGKPEDDKKLEVTVHYLSATCGSITESQWIADQQQYELTLAALHKGTISDSTAKFPVVDFDRYGVLLISMGQQRTGGYSVKLASNEMNIVDGRGKVRVQWNTKKPGMITIQMLTNPCLLLKVPKGDYSAIDVLDQLDNIRTSVAVTSPR